MEQYSSRVYGLALRLTGNKDDAEDVLQEAFLTVMQKLDTFQGRSAIYTWIHRIATNIALGKLRKLRKAPDVDIEPDDFKALSSGLAEHTFHFEDDYDTQFLREAIDRSLQKLPEHLRVVFLLRDVEGFNTQETADMLDITVANVKVRLMRARIQLRNLLAHVRPQGGNT